MNEIGVCPPIVEIIAGAAPLVLKLAAIRCGEVPALFWRAKLLQISGVTGRFSARLTGSIPDYQTARHCHLRFQRTTSWRFPSIDLNKRAALPDYFKRVKIGRRHKQQ